MRWVCAVSLFRRRQLECQAELHQSHCRCCVFLFNTGSYKAVKESRMSTLPFQPPHFSNCELVSDTGALELSWTSVGEWLRAEVCCG